jgi:hypothetical protein
MGFCDDDTNQQIRKLLRKKRKRKTSHSTGRNAGHRYRGKPKMVTQPIAWTVEQPGDDVSIPAPGTPIERRSPKTEEMWDTHGYIQNWYNPCVKEKYQGGNVPWENVEDEDGVVIDFHDQSPSARASIRATVPFLTEAQLDELALQSELKLSSVVKQNVMLVNFLLELYRTITGKISNIRKFSGVYNAAIKAYWKAKKRYLSQGHKEAAAHWLAWNFAIKPTISDLKGILCSITYADAKMKWMQNNNHKIVYMDYSRDLTELLDYDPAEFLPGEFHFSILKADPLASYPNGFYQTFVRWTDEVKLEYHARSKIFLDIPDDLLDGNKGIGTLWAAMQGLYNPIGIVWEAIPFTWLIDYFLSYRARLFQQIYDQNPFDKGITVLGFGHSFKFSGIADVRVFRNRNPELGLEGELWNYYGRVKYDLYWRRAGLPFPEQVTYFRLPGDGYRLSIIGALAVGILPGKRKH